MLYKQNFEIPKEKWACTNFNARKQFSFGFVRVWFNKMDEFD